MTSSTAEITLILSFIKKALWNNARAGQDYPRVANNWKFYLWRWEENMYTIFCYNIFWFDNADVSKQWKSSARLPIKVFIFKNFILHACLTFAFRLLLADPDPGPRDLDSCNPILSLKVICILRHKTSVGRFILQIGVSFCDVQQHFETKVVDR